MEPLPGQPESRTAMIARVIGEVLQARTEGKSASDEEVIAAHPELQPELAQELEKVRRIEAAGRAAFENQSRETVSTAGKAPDASIDRTVEVPRYVARVPGYSILHELNRGGQGVVYVATQLSTGRKVALKVLRDGPLADDRKLARFQREVQVLAALNHPNIVTIIDTGQAADGSRYIVMNYIAGMDLNKYMIRRQQKDPDDPSKLLRMFLKICDAVNAAHQKGIVHRDLKPGNIRVDERGEPHVLDFGLARTGLDGVGAEDQQPLSVTGEFMGSLPWCSPEQAEGDPDKIDARTDVYSLGVILYQMLTGGRFPYKVVGNIRDVLNNILTATPTPPSKLIAKAAREAKTDSREPRIHPTSVNETIERIVMKALSKERKKRYQTAGELKKDITNYLLGRQTVSTPPEVQSTLGSKVRKWGLFAGTAVLFLAFGVAGVILGRHTSTASTNDPLAASMSSSVPLHPAESPKFTTAKAVLKPNPQAEIDLLAGVNLANDQFGGNWVRIGDELIADRAGPAKLRLPAPPDGEYDFELSFTPLAGDLGVGQILTFAGHPFAFFMGDHNTGYSIPRAAGTIASPLDFSSTYLPSLTNARRYTSIVKVREHSITAYLDGVRLFEVHTDYTDMQHYPLWSAMPASLGVTSYRTLIVHSAKATPVRAPAISSASKAIPVATTGQVDLLQLADPWHDAVAGQWEWISQALVSKPSENARFEFPYVPPAEYDYVVKFVRTRGDRGMVLTGPAQGHRYGWEVAGWGNSVCGFDRISGRMANINETAKPYSMPPGTHTTEVRVRRGSIEGYVDGKLFCRVETDFTGWDVAPGMKLRRDNTLGFYANQNGVRIESAKVFEVSGTGRRLR